MGINECVVLDEVKQVCHRCNRSLLFQLDIEQ